MILERPHKNEKRKKSKVRNWLTDDAGDVLAYRFWMMNDTMHPIKITVVYYNC